MLVVPLTYQQNPRGDTPEILGGGVQPASQNPKPIYGTRFWPKSAIFLTLFQ